MSASEIYIRPASKEDMVAVAVLIQELANYQEMPDGPKIDAKVLQRDGFESTPPAFRCLVAENPGREGAIRAIVGYALYYHTYSSWEGRAAMIQGLYVTEDQRRRGIGDKLFNAVAKETVSAGCSRLEFHVLQWNSARTFYERKGAVDLTNKEQWCCYRLDGAALWAAAEGL